MLPRVYINKKKTLLISLKKLKLMYYFDFTRNNINNTYIVNSIFLEGLCLLSDKVVWFSMLRVF